MLFLMEMLKLCYSGTGLYWGTGGFTPAFEDYCSNGNYIKEVRKYQLLAQLVLGTLQLAREDVQGAMLFWL